MLVEEPWRYELKERDYEYYEKLLPGEDPLLDALEMIDWDSFAPVLAQYYSPNMGQPAILPVLMLKLEFLRYFRRLSDRDVIGRSKTDILFRYFLQVPVRFQLPAPTSLVYFRGRLGVEGFENVFNRLVASARQAGLVRDRLRLKDASHVFANIAVPSTMKLLAQLREKMLAEIKEIDSVAASGYEIELRQIRQDTEGAAKEIRLEQRIDLIESMLQWLSGKIGQTNSAEGIDIPTVQSVCDLASKILSDLANPGAGDRTLSVVDPDARRGKHGEWYDGYCLDIMMDADSQLITSVDVLVAGGDEAQSAVNLVKTEQAAHGNSIEAFSIDGVGFNGPMLHELEAPEGLGITVYTPPPKVDEQELFKVEEFKLSEDGRHVVCPAGNQSKVRQRDDARHRTYFRFAKAGCESCPLLSSCMVELGPERNAGRGVTKSDFEAEHQRARARATTEEFEAVRKEHPAIERKINEVMNHQGGRYAKYWGRKKMKIQALMTCFAVDVKRIIRLTNDEDTALVCN